MYDFVQGFGSFQDLIPFSFNCGEKVEGVNPGVSLLALSCHTSSDVLCSQKKYQCPKASADDCKSLQLLLTLHVGSTAI